VEMLQLLKKMLEMVVALKAWQLNIRLPHSL
jgi:hypothetical protein